MCLHILVLAIPNLMRVIVALPVVMPVRIALLHAALVGRHGPRTRHEATSASTAPVCSVPVGWLLGGSLSLILIRS